MYERDSNLFPLHFLSLSLRDCRPILSLLLIVIKIKSYDLASQSTGTMRMDNDQVSHLLCSPESDGLIEDTFGMPSLARSVDISSRHYSSSFLYRIEQNLSESLFSACSFDSCGCSFFLSHSKVKQLTNNEQKRWKISPKTCQKMFIVR